MKRPAGGQSSTGRRTRRRVENRVIMDFRTEVEYVTEGQRRVPHIITVRPVRLQNFEVRRVAREISNRLQNTFTSEVRRFVGRRRRRVNAVLNGIFLILL